MKKSLKAMVMKSLLEGKGQDFGKVRNCPIRIVSEPRVFASIRNLAISLLNLHGFKNIAASLRKLEWNRELVLLLIGV